MRNDELFEILGDIDEEKIVKAEEPVKKKNILLKFGAFAASAVIVLAIGIPAVNKIVRNGHTSQPNGENVIIAETEDKLILPAVVTKENVKKDKILYWDDYKDRISFADGTYSCEVSLVADMEKIKEYNMPIVTNDLGAIELARKGPILTEYSQNMQIRDWELVMSDFESATGFSYYDFISRIPDKWRYPEFFTFNPYEESDGGDYIFKSEIVSGYEFISFSSPEITIRIRKGKEPETGVCDYLKEGFKGKENETLVNEIPMTIYEADMFDRVCYFVTFEQHGAFYEIETKSISSVYLYELLYNITLPEEKRSSDELPEIPVRIPMDYQYKSGNVFKEMYYLDRGIKYVDFDTGLSKIWTHDYAINVDFGEPPLAVYSGKDHRFLVINECECVGKSETGEIDDDYCNHDNYTLVYSEKINGINVDFDFYKRYINNTDTVDVFTASYEYNDQKYHIYGNEGITHDEMRELLSLVLISQ